MAMKRSLFAAFAILACLMFAWATGAGRPHPASAGGVIDPTCASASPCIEYDNNGAGPGIRGISLSGNGLAGSTKNRSTFTNARAGLIGNDIGTGTFNSGVHGLSVNGTGVSGQSTNAVGVSGTGLAIGVSGDAPSGVGVRGDTGGGLGVRGDASSGIGVFGESINGIGIEGTSPNYVGIAAVGGVIVGINRYPALSVQAPDTGSFSPDLIAACVTPIPNPCTDNTAVFRVSQADSGSGPSTVVWAGSFASTGNPNAVGGGGFQTNGLCVTGCTSSPAATRRVRTYAPQSSQPMIEDNGEAQLVNGAAYVRVDPAFANVIEQRAMYSVSITPEGDSNGLFVTQKTLAGFLVHENHGGRSTLAFEYRIVAKPFGSTAKRLPMVDVPLRSPTIGPRRSHPVR